MAITAIFDTLAYAKKLRAAGFTEDQAEIQAQARPDPALRWYVGRRHCHCCQLSEAAVTSKSRVPESFPVPP